MSSRKHPRGTSGVPLRAETDSEDRENFGDFDRCDRLDRRSRDAKRDRKLRQLCRAVARTLGFVLPPDVAVIDVLPAPDAGRLLVIVSGDPSTAGGAVAQSAGRIRCEVAAALRRRRAPEIVFRFAAEGTGGPGEGGRP
jgi:ribosome-binding factor A